MIPQMSSRERWVLLPVVVLWAFAVAVLLGAVISWSLPQLGLPGWLALALGAWCAPPVVVIVVHAWAPERKRALAGVALGLGGWLAWSVFDPMGSWSLLSPTPPGLAAFSYWAVACIAGTVALLACSRRSRRCPDGLSSPVQRRLRARWPRDAESLGGD